MTVRRTAVPIVAISLLALSSPAAEAETLGRWCDQPVPNAAMAAGKDAVITIFIEDGLARATFEFADGSVWTPELVERGKGAFDVVGSPSGDGYRVNSMTGDLDLVDDIGFIRSAFRLGIEPNDGECYR